MTFVVTVKSETAGAEQGVDRLVTKLETAETAGVKAGEAISKGARANSASMVLAEKAANQARDAMGRFTKEGAAGLARANTATGVLASSTGNLIGQVNALAVAYLGFHAVHGALDFADDYQKISNKLRVVATDQANLNGLMAATFNIAQETRSEWEQTAGAYQRIAKATEHLGTSQQEVLDLTREISQGLAIAGSNTQEARMTMMELTHAFELGALTGREFKVVLKDATPIVGLLAESLGITRAKFIEMGKHGKITADLLREGFAKAGPEIQRQFEKMIPTIEQSGIIMKNALSKFFGEAGTGSGVLQGLARAIRFVADHMDTFGKIALGVGEALIGLYVIEKIIVMVRALTVAIAANPLGALLVAVTVGIALLRQFGDEINTQHQVWSNVAGVYVTVGDYLRALWDMFKQLGSVVVDFVENAWGKLTSAFSAGIDGEAIELSLRNVLLFVASFVDAWIAMFKALYATVNYVFIGIPVTILAVVVEVARNVAAVVQSLINGLIDAVNSLMGRISVARMKAAAVEAQKKGLTGDAAKQYVGERMFVEEGYGKVDLSFKNPLADASTKALKDVENAWTKDFGSTYARDLVNGFVDKLDAAARDKAAERIASAAKAGTIGTKGEGHAGEHVDAKAAKAAASYLKSLAGELASVERASNPVTAAELKLSKAIDVANRALYAHLIPYGEWLTIIGDTAKKTEDARLPLQAWTRDIDKEIAALGLSNKERERTLEIQKAIDDLRGKGVTGPDVTAAVTEHVDLKRSAEEAAKYREAGALAEFKRGLEETTKQLQFGAVSAKQYDEAVRGLEDAYFAATHAGKDFGDGFARGMHSLKAEITDVGALVESSMKDAYRGIEDGLVAMATNSEFSIKKMVDSILANLARIGIRQAITSVIGAIGGAIGAGGGDYASATGSGATQAFPGYYGSAPGYTGRIAPGGGGGDGVNVAPQGQAASSATPAAAPRLTIVNVYDRSEMRAFMEEEGPNYHVNYMKQSKPAYRGRTTGR